MKTQVNYRFMDSGERNKLPEGYKTHPLIKEFPGVWTRFKNWIAHPPMVAVKGDKIVGFHVATFNKKLYINSYYLYVDVAYRGQGIAGNLFLFAIAAAQKRGLTRYKNACMETGDGYKFYRGFKLKPIARNEDHMFFDFSIENIHCLSDLPPKRDTVPLKALEFHQRKGRTLLVKEPTFKGLEKMLKL